VKALLGLGLGLVAVLAGCTSPREPVATTSHARFTPAAGQHWQIQLTGEFDDSVAANVYDLDPYTTDQATVTDITADGGRAICHLDAGAADMTLPDAASVPAAVLGATDGAGRRWLDIRDWDALRPVLSARLELCRVKGFQGVDADQTYGYANESGFDLTSDDQVTYDLRVADLAHSYGLAVGVRTVPSMARRIEPFVDFTVVDGCFTTPDCADYFAFIEADKAVYDVETGASAAFCTLARVYGFAAIRKPDDVLDGRVVNC
jgi:hypothetical protein